MEKDPAIVNQQLSYLSCVIGKSVQVTYENGCLRGSDADHAGGGQNGPRECKNIRFLFHKVGTN